MRKLMVLPMVGLLVLAVAAPVAAKPNVSNTSGGGESISGEWYDGNTYGYVSVGEETNGGGFGFIYQETGTWVLCDPAPGGGKGAQAADDTGPGDGYYGFVGTRTSGYTDSVQVTLSRRLATGSATGQIELTEETVDECLGFYDKESLGVVDLKVNVTGVGSVLSFRSRSTYKIPSEFNGHSSYSGKERAATGSVDAGSISAIFDFAYMTQVSWTDHINS